MRPGPGLMRVLVVPKWFPSPERPVFGIFCREQARAVARRHDVIVLASDPVRAPSFRAFQLSDGVEEGLRTLRVRYRRPWFRPAAMGFQIAGMLVALGRLRRQGWRPDVVHAHVYSAGLPALILARLSRAGLVISEHYTGFQRGLVTGYDLLTARLAFRYANLVAPVSADLARQLQRVQPRARLRVVENAVETEVFHPSSEPRRSRRGVPARLLTVASLVPKKGHRDLLVALGELRRERPVTLDLVGEGELRGELEAQVRRLGLSEVVSFHGELPREGVAELMREADLFVLPSHFENLPCVLIEAMASGLGSVATEVGGVAELLSGGDAGRLVPPGEPAALAAAIAAALDGTPADRAALARRAGERFGFEAIAAAWSRIYAELARGS